LLDASRIEHFSARHEFTSPELPLGSGVLGANAPSLPARSIGLRLARWISDGIHEDYDLTSYAAMPVRLNLEVAIQSDFADIFDVRWKKIVLRGSLQTAWHQASGELRTSYRNGTFRRDLVVKVDKADSPPQFANGSLVFAVPLEPKGTWHVCLRWLPVIDRRRGRALECHALLEKTAKLDTKVLPPVDLD